MTTGGQVLIPPFRLDWDARKLRHGENEIHIRPKVFDVLSYLVERPGRLIAKQELLDAVWHDASVTEGVLKVCVRELREALVDDERKPRYIQTVHRSGYRFIGSVLVGNIPLPAARFVGRQRELEKIETALRGHRLVTLTGPGGSGKTRLAREVLLRARDYPRGLWWVDLGAVADPALVPHAVFAALGQPEHLGRTPTEALCRELASRKLLLTLDNCEHVIDSCAALVRSLLLSCGEIHLLVTSRERLGISGEICVTVPPLPVPRFDTTAASVLKNEAVQLLMDRAQAANPAISQDDWKIAAQICRRLEGLPLAIELAAARARLLSLNEIAERLDQSLDVLAASNRDVPARHQTLHATIDWSYRLLSDEERVLVHRLSRFAGPWSPADAEEICSDSRIPRNAILDLLMRLHDKSFLVQTHEAAPAYRYRILEMIREYAQGKTGAQEDETQLLTRFIRHYVKVVEIASARINSGQRASSLARLDAERDNISAALKHAAQIGSFDQQAAIAASLVWYWFHGGQWIEGQRIISGILSHAPNRTRCASLAQLHFGEGLLAWTSGQNPKAAERLRRAVGLARELDDSETLAQSLHFLAMVELGAGNVGDARRMAEESLAVVQNMAAPPSFTHAAVRASRGIVALAEGDFHKAKTFLEEALAIAESSGDSWMQSLPLRNLGILSARMGEYTGAIEYLRRSLTVLRPWPERWFVSRSLESLAEVLAMKGDYRRSAVLFGASETLRDYLGARVLPFYRSDFEAATERLRAALRPRALEAALGSGRRMSVDEALTYALR